MSKKDQDLLIEIHDRFKEAYDAADTDYTTAIEDLEFYNGDQWPSDLASERSLDGRPTLTINKLPTFADQVIGDIRQNKPQIKVKPVDSQADPKTAEIMTGLIRNVEVQSDAEVAYDTAVESAIVCGFGAWRITTEYSDNDVFDQDIRIRRIKNPFTVFWDPAATEWDKSDARFCFVTEKIPKKDFEKRYPEVSTSDAEGGHDVDKNWGDDRYIRIVEYFRKKPVKKTIYLMEQLDPMSGQPIGRYVTEMKPSPENLGPAWREVSAREVESFEIEVYKATYGEILETGTWPGRYIPIVSVFGKETNIESTSTYRGIVRNAKDSQRLYNYSRSTGAEMISLAPRAPFLVTAKQIGPYLSKWDVAHKKNFPYLPYDVDPQNPQAIPHRSEPIMVNTGINNEIMISDQELHDTTGLQRASLGKKSNEKSGRAIMARQREGDVANFAYHDNMARSLRYTGRICVDLIPKIYDTARVLRIINPDGSDQRVQVNAPFQNQQGMSQLFDLTVGKYDVVVDVGPSYTTQREEMANSMLMFIQAVPQAGMLIADLFAKSLDWPGADKIEERLRLLLPPQIQATLSGGGPPPPPQPPSPGEVLQLRGLAADVQNKELTNEEQFHKVERLKRGLPMEPKEKAAK